MPRLVEASSEPRCGPPKESQSITSNFICSGPMVRYERVCRAGPLGLAGIADWMTQQLSNPKDAPSQSRPHPGAALPEIRRSGVGADAARACLRDVVLPTAFPTDHSLYLGARR